MDYFVQDRQQWPDLYYQYAVENHIMRSAYA